MTAWDLLQNVIENEGWIAQLRCQNGSFFLTVMYETRPGVSVRYCYHGATLDAVVELAVNGSPSTVKNLRCPHCHGRGSAGGR